MVSSNECLPSKEEESLIDGGPRAVSGCPLKQIKVMAGDLIFVFAVANRNRLEVYSK
jgi:hypothetical protein